MGEIVKPPTAPCECVTCQHLGKRIQRERWTKRAAALQFKDLEAEVTERWHLYRPHLDRVSLELPARPAHMTYDAKETTALRKLRNWNDQEGEYEDVDDNNIAVLAGPPGTGKTLAAVWLVMHRWAEEDPRFMTGMELSRIPRYGDEREAILECGALVIDDLGVEKPDAKFTSDFDELIDRFYRGHGQLVITTNRTSKEFREHYGIRVIDRLAERGTWIPITGKSMRGARGPR